ncbi:MAG: VWA domain-containing protein, partial [Myxococcota bacterium]
CAPAVPRSLHPRQEPHRLRCRNRRRAPASGEAIAELPERTGRESAPIAGAGSSGVLGRGVKNPRPMRKKAKGRADTIYRRRPTASALKAGRHDDNAQYNRFLRFMDENSGVAPYPVDVSERLVIRTLDTNGRALHNCGVEIRNLDGELRARTTTYADGRTQFFPSAQAQPDETEFTIQARCNGKVRNGQLARKGKRETELRFTRKRRVPRRVPVDVSIVLDTTGSMSAQINRLKETLNAIHVQLTALPSNPDIRFSLVAYRDRGDAYVTQFTTFTDDVDMFQQVLDGLDADGGGDTPEDLQSALQDAMKKLPWRKDAVRVGFIVADAVPHTDYGQQYTYRSAMLEALDRGIKWISVGAGGLPREGEVIFRQIAQYTMGEYVFVTGSGGGDTDGSRSEASHHVGTNYKTENLDQAMVRIVRRELSHLTDTPRDFDSTIVATATEPLPRDVALAPAVKEALRQLMDYSSIRLEAGTPVAVAPFTTNNKETKSVAEYVTDQMVLYASREELLQLVDRDLEAVAQEISIQVSELFDATKSVEVGQMVGAQVLIVGKLTVRKDGADLFARLVRVETGEILSVAKVKLDRNVLASS